MRAWRALLSVHLDTFAELDRAVRRFGVNTVEYGILAYLSEQPDRTMLLSDLADVSFLSLSRLSHRLDRLEELGYVRRRPCEDDGRSTYAQLTPAGRKFLTKIAPRHLEDVRRLFFDHLDARQVRALGDALIAIVGRDVTSTTPAP